MAARKFLTARPDAASPALSPAPAVRLGFFSTTSTRMPAKLREANPARKRKHFAVINHSDQGQTGDSILVHGNKEPAGEKPGNRRSNGSGSTGAIFFCCVSVSNCRD